jgi:hypothetical protein
MKYQFTQKAKDRKQEIIKEFETQVKVSREKRDKLHKKCIDEVPLLEQLLELDIEKEPHMELSKESWEVIYISNGWVKEEPWWLDSTKKQIEKGKQTPETLVKRLREFDDYEKNSHFVKGDKRALYSQDVDNIDNWQSMKQRTRTSERLLKLFKEASFDLSLLDRHKTIYQHEGFLILLGICPSEIDKKYVIQWELNSTWFKNEDGDLGKGSRDYEEWEWVEREFKTKKEKLFPYERKKMSDKERREYVKPIEIDKQQFIEWVKQLGYIEKNTLLRDSSKAPFKEDFAKMLYDELIAHNLITGEFKGRWAWVKETGAYSFLVRMLHKNSIPMNYHLDYPSKNIKWDNLKHYINVSYKGHPRDYKTTSMESAVEEVVTKLLTEYNNTPKEQIKYL